MRDIRKLFFLIYLIVGLVMAAMLAVAGGNSDERLNHAAARIEAGNAMSVQTNSEEGKESVETETVSGDSDETEAIETEGSPTGEVRESQAKETETQPKETEAPLPKGSRYAWVKVNGRVNVRSKPKKSSEYLGSIKYRQRVVVKGKKTKGFYKINGQDCNTKKELTGYCSGKFLTFKQPEDPKVKLDVPAFLQTDERWADVTLGRSGKTMYDIGCATTCLAMCESYLTGKTIYPDEMADQLFYLRSGDLEWPLTYYWNYSKDRYLEFIYGKLKENIPVLINCNRRNGRPHWVLVTGYTGNGEDFKTSDFLINDPLPYGRTTLKEFQDEYPVFKLMIYYTGKERKRE